MSSSIVYVLLKLGVIVSTGLLVLEPTTLQKTGVPFLVKKSLSSSDFSVSIVQSDPFVAYYGIQAQGLGYLVGTSDNLVVPQFEPVDPQANATSFTAVVEGLSTYFDFEVVYPTNQNQTVAAPWIILLAPFFLMNIDTPSCKINGVSVGQGPKSFHPLVESMLQQYQGWIGAYTCNTGYEVDTYAPGTLPVNSILTDHRLIIMNSLVKWNTTNDPRNVWVDKHTTLLCKPSYSINHYQVDLSQSSNDVGRAVQAK